MVQAVLSPWDLRGLSFVGGTDPGAPYDPAYYSAKVRSDFGLPLHPDSGMDRPTSREQLTHRRAGGRPGAEEPPR